MRFALMLAASVCVPTMVSAQVAISPGSSRVGTISVGGGNSFGWWGVQAEKYVSNGRISIFGGVGRDADLMHLRSTDNFAFAAGARIYTNGLKHRLFAELSLSEIVAEASSFSYGNIIRTPHYGPGLQGGYQFVNSHGITLMASFGYGYALGLNSSYQHMALQPLAGFSIGYTLR